MRLELRDVLKGLIGSILLMGCWSVLPPLRGESSVSPAFQVLPNPRRLPSGAAVSKVLSIQMPVALAFAPDGRIFITEKGGFQGNREARVWVFDGLALRPWLTLTVSTDGERGLLGIALDPDFNQNRYVYLVYTSAGPQPLWRLVRYRDKELIPSY